MIRINQRWTLRLGWDFKMLLEKHIRWGSGHFGISMRVPLPVVRAPFVRRTLAWTCLPSSGTTSMTRQVPLMKIGTGFHGDGYCPWIIIESYDGKPGQSTTKTNSQPPFWGCSDEDEGYGATSHMPLDLLESHPVDHFHIYIRMAHLFGFFHSSMFDYRRVQLTLRSHTTQEHWLYISLFDMEVITNLGGFTHWIWWIFPWLC